MVASVEISMYPLNREYGTTILKFIERLKGYPELSMHSNTMSTQIFGPYDLLMDVLKKEIRTSFEKEEDVVMVFKMVNLDLSP